MAHYLITGGAGFIGSHLADDLLAAGHSVTVLDDISTGRRDNIAHLASDSNFHFLHGSATDIAAVRRAAESVDGIYHLAASVGVKRIVEQLVSSIANTVKATEVVLEVAAKNHTKTLITSTSEVYGRGGDRDPFQEEDDLRMGPTQKTRWSYACSKALDEYLALAYHFEQQLPVTIARLFNTVGDRQLDTYGMVLPRFVKQALSGEPLTIYGTGQQTRCFCYVKDTTRALRLLMESPATDGQVYNIGNNEEVTIAALAEQVISQLESTSKTVTIPYEQAYGLNFEDIDRRVPNLNKIKAAVGWEPEISLSQIIGRVAESHKVAAHV